MKPFDPPFDPPLEPAVEEIVHDHLITVDGAATEVLPHFWMTSGFTAYDGHIPIAAFDSAGPDAPAVID